MDAQASQLTVQNISSSVRPRPQSVQLPAPSLPQEDRPFTSPNSYPIVEMFGG